MTRSAVRLHRNSDFVHALLRHFEAVGFDGAPRFLGIDREGREILAYVEGEVFVAPTRSAIRCRSSRTSSAPAPVA